jgi:peptide-methionine (S)-S-oxide reductase
MHQPASWLPLALLLACTALAACSGNGTPAESAPPPTPAPPTTMPEPRPAATTETATLAAGCFWCIEAVLERVDGVLDVRSGYMGGQVENPSYEQVCTGQTGHAEAVQVTFDPAQLAFADLLDWFFRAHDPTTRNRQGNDIGTQYRSAIFCHGEAQREAALAAKQKAQGLYANPIVTEITAASTFWPADDYHQDFFRRNPTQGYCRATIPPKLKKLGLDKK